jgi:DNA invertase Pin-like site-specific DNA recombinase
MKMGAPTKAATKPVVRKVRCAVYTRKSSEEGLDMEFNSLDAQRAACESFVASQRPEGWVLVHDRYDDGGVSGGTLERPALQRLLGGIENGLVDVVVVYKIDRLSRSLMDFAKLVDVFDRHAVTFVSVTQSFNTTTSMGRLTLNILLSFAQFEREVIGERIRDKIAASRARGMWMGGKVPLGYDVRDRKLVVNGAEAATVRRVFEGFAEIGSATALTKVLRAESVTTKQGKPINKGDIYKLLNNRTYVGEAAHKGQVYPGEHEAIISRELWDGVHALLGESPRARANKNRLQSPALLKGADLRGGRAGAVADAHAAARAAVSLLRGATGVEGGRGRSGRRAPGVRRRVRGGRGGPGPGAAAAAGDHRRHLGRGAGGAAGPDGGRSPRGARQPGPAVGGTVPSGAGAHRPAPGRTGRDQAAGRRHPAPGGGARQLGAGPGRPAFG